MKNLFSERWELSRGKADIIAGTAVMAVSAFMILWAIPNHISIGFGSTAYITPKTFPYGVSIVSLICGLEILISGFLAWKKEKHSQIKASPITLHFVAFLIFALGILFSGALKTIGYPIVNTLSILAMYYISGGKKIWVGVITAVSFSVVSYLFFSVYLKLSIPLGLGL